MKITIANSLLEPAGIPWDDIAPHTLWSSIEITAAVIRYTNAIEEHLHEGLPNIDAHDVAMGIKQVIRNHGIKEVYAGYRKLTWRDGSRSHQFHAAYRIPGDGELKNIHVNILNL